MSLLNYFKSSSGTGVLSTADDAGRVNSAIYARPHVIDEETVAFIMSKRQSLENVRSNPRASYLFIEEGNGYSGKRLSLTCVREDDDRARMDELRKQRGKEIFERYAGLDASLVYFRVDAVRPLVGDGEA